MSRPLLLLVLVVAAGCSAEDNAWNRWWLTPDQRGDRLMAAGRFEEALAAYLDPHRRGVAAYRAGEFETAAAEFGRVPTAEGAFNRGNALVMRGKYEDAIASYDAALEARGSFGAAIENRAIAQARLDKLAPPEDDAGGTGGKLGADEIVFDDRKGGSSEQVEVGQGEELSDEELRQLWLRRVETKPQDFLKAKFSYQQARAAAEEESR